MGKIMTAISAIIGKNARRRSYITTMICLDCGRKWQAHRVSDPCPGCASRAVVAAGRWWPAKYGMPVLGPRHSGNKELTAA
ncbi:hypothetical protein [Desulfobacter vibrioformis]|uniref:hypothetical protein n=1 Tax=Desulfobacter vibrioformis TaxID=34031 RepID=UPI0005540C84|nr:hypothetical protein [Desulfobacter vibrioformis]